MVRPLCALSLVILTAAFTPEQTARYLTKLKAKIAQGLELTAR